MPTRRTLLATALASLAAPVAARAADYRSALEAAYGGPLDLHVAFAGARRECAALQRRADALLRGQGLGAGPVGARLRTLAGDARDLYADDSAGRDKAVADMNARVAAVLPMLTRAIDLPIAQAFARRMPAADVSAGKGGYRVAPQEGQPGAYYVDLRAIRQRPAWTLPTVAFHEVIPGHLFQLPLQAAAHPPADRVKASAAYFEAWAIYAEELCAVLGAFDDDPRGEIGYLQWRLFRMGRIVADIGLGARNWSRDQAIATLRDLQGFDAAFISIEADVDRMAANPGKYAAEGLGALALTRWRPVRRDRWPAYHRVILNDGPWPFGELERRLAA